MNRQYKDWKDDPKFDKVKLQNQATIEQLKEEIINANYYIGEIGGYVNFSNEYKTLNSIEREMILDHLNFLLQYKGHLDKRVKFKEDMERVRPIVESGIAPIKKLEPINIKKLTKEDIENISIQDYYDDEEYEILKEEFKRLAKGDK